MERVEDYLGFSVVGVGLDQVEADVQARARVWRVGSEEWKGGRVSNLGKDGRVRAATTRVGALGFQAYQLKNSSLMLVLVLVLFFFNQYNQDPGPRLPCLRAALRP